MQDKRIFTVVSTDIVEDRVSEYNTPVAYTENRTTKLGFIRDVAYTIGSDYKTYVMQKRARDFVSPLIYKVIASSIMTRLDISDLI